MYNWIKDFLFGRMQRVRVNKEVSPETEVLSGIPQGSILGPVLFTIFINDLPDCIETTCKIFADDTKIYDISSNCTNIQNDLYKLQEWSDLWNLYFNVSKCKVMYIGKNNPETKYNMKLDTANTQIISCNAEKDLGVTFDKNLNFDQHINNIVNKANQVLGVIKRTFTYLDRDVFIKLYKALVRPHLEYGNVIWNPYLKRQTKAIEKVQRRATKLVKECQNMSNIDRLNYLRLHSLKGRRLKGDIIETYQILNGLEGIQTDRLFKLAENTNTRNTDNKLYIRYCKTNKRKFFFSFRVAQCWNNLPNTYKKAPSTNIFKNLLVKDTKFIELFTDYDDY